MDAYPSPCHGEVGYNCFTPDQHCARGYLDQLDMNEVTPRSGLGRNHFPLLES